MGAVAVFDKKGEAKTISDRPSKTKIAIAFSINPWLERCRATAEIRSGETHPNVQPASTIWQRCMTPPDATVTQSLCMCDRCKSEINS